MNINTSLLNKKDIYIIGVSGGVDSMSLLDILQKQGYQLHVCHVNYHLRNDSNEDQILVKNYCEQHYTPCYVKEINKEEYQESNFQMQARHIRYAFYQEIGKEVGTNKVILGHHLDDVLETIYMQIERKNTKGYLGIQEISNVLGNIVYRPLLQVTKQELYAYCLGNKVVYHEDYTNFQTEFTRDYVRNISLKEYSTMEKEALLLQAKEHNLRYSRQQKEIESYLSLYKEQGYLCFVNIPKKLWEGCIYQMVKEVVYPPDISNALIEEIVKQIQSNKPNIEVIMPLNTVFIKEYDNSYISRYKREVGYCLKYPCLVYDKHTYFKLSKEGELNEGIQVRTEDFPLTIRTYRPGDTILTSGGTKKISRLFIDNKISKRMRQIWPIVERADGTIILVPNIAKNIDYLYTKPNVFVVKYKNLGSEYDEYASRYKRNIM
jgi:tRNA(Ile)-lysidine synthase